jgi:hypothetical protein
MEILDLFYIALGTVGILIVLHLSTFWIARVLQPPKPKIVYVQAPAPPAAPAPAPPPPPPTLSEPAVKAQLPTYDVPPRGAAPSTAPGPVAALPPPLETRNTTKQSSGDIGTPR